MNDPRGPIEHFTWGKYIISGVEHSDNGEKIGFGKDIRLIGTEVTEWVERKGHLLTINMITGVYDQNLDILIIGNGVDGVLVCPDEVIRQIDPNEIRQVIILRTPEACEKYNDLLNQGSRVALLAHGTC